MSVPEREACFPGIVVPFGRLVRKSSVLTYGNELAGYGLIVTMVFTWVTAAIRGWRPRHCDYGQDALFLVGAALVPAVWVLLLPHHTYVHAAFMARMLVVPISLAPLAWCWPAAQETSIPPGVFSV